MEGGITRWRERGIEKDELVTGVSQLWPSGHISSRIAMTATNRNQYEISVC